MVSLGIFFKDEDHLIIPAVVTPWKDRDIFFSGIFCRMSDEVRLDHRSGARQNNYQRSSPPTLAVVSRHLRARTPP